MQKQLSPPKKYQDLSILSAQQVQLLKSTQRKIFFYDQLIIDVTQFSHPGTKAIFDKVNNNISIKSLFEKNNHSYNAKVILAQLTIGRFQVKQGDTGKQIFDYVRNSEMTKTHEIILQKLDFQKPIHPQVNKFTQFQKQVFVFIPKFLTHPEKLVISLGQRGLYPNNYLYQRRFWVSLSVFVLTCIFLIFYALKSNDGLSKQFFLALFLGMMLWPALQYYFHRIVLHHKFCQKDSPLTDHEVHHAFPNLPSKLPLSIFHVYKYLVPIFFVLNFVIGDLNATTFVTGTLIAVICYDSLHYYFHFGPQINIWPINILRKNHLKHHFRDPHLGFGVTNTVYDHIFGTAFKD